MKKKKRPMTLLEIMIVIFIIGIIGSVIGYNMRGSLEEAKAFKTEQGMKKVSEILTLQLATDTSAEEIRESPGDVLKSSGLVSNVEKLLKDGWNKPYKITVLGDEVKVSSDAYAKFRKKKGKKVDDDLDADA